ncbi:class IV lanthionine synthetase LanL [Kitasatospora azatica]|uniref:class IV lanthionine synthetase LanL n=1 Tax=Kitasatospora azatica TaxID=58347 RepID=UPI00068D6428|nr:class IV lanthionine synthetase LanL [Kitasatospora azatica]
MQEQQGKLAFPLRSVVRAVLAELGEDGWSVQESGVWCRVEPPVVERRVQGWKLHVSATRLSAPEVLTRAAEVLIRGGCAFKCARDLALTEEMTSHRYDRAQCGKFITAYPRDDDHFRELAAALDAATAGLPGPAVLSDRPYRPGSLVHFRYGAFYGVPTLTADGVHEVRLQAPDGTAVPDPRKPWFSPPAWAVPPIEAKPAPAPAKPAADGTPTEPKPVLINDRYVVREAITFSARGGVYRALDQRTGADVVVKQARAHVGVGLPAGDARDALRQEARTLARLSGLAAELVEFFEADGHAFLVESLVEGQPLTRYVQERLAADGEAFDPGEVLRLARDLTALVTEIHHRGLVYQDFTPNNVIVTPDDRLVLIDPEHAAPVGDWAVHAYTPGFGAPEQVLSRRYARVDDAAVDLFALGAVFCYLATGLTPAYLEDEPKTRTPRERTAHLLDRAADHYPAVALLAPAILGLMAQDPADRWPLAKVAHYLATTQELATAQDPAARTFEPALPAWPAPDEPLRRRMLDDGLAHLVATMDPDADERLWESSAFAATADTLAVQHGAAGVLALLTRADAALDRPELRVAVERAARWTDDRLTRVQHRLPGLYFGRSGTAWALHDAARHLGDAELAARAEDFVLSLPVRWPNPDVCHGAAGAGFAQLHLWRATGREEFLARVADCADGLLDCAERTDGSVYWQVAPDLDSNLAGIRQLGFGHGVAGVGAFLLAAWQATGRQPYLDLAVEAGRTLAAEAEYGPWGARWRSDRDGGPGKGMLYHWCNGSSGVGTFLLRLWQATGEDAFLRPTEQAAVAVHRMRWLAPSAACHGLAGNGQFLLDLDEALGGPYRQWTLDLVDVMHVRHALRDGRIVLPDESGRSVRADYQTGLAGPLDLLLRLDHGGPRLWMTDAPAVQVPAAAAPALLGAAR